MTPGGSKPVREREFHERMWGYAKDATVAYVRIGDAWHPTRPDLPLPPDCTGFSYKSPTSSMTSTWGGQHYDWP